MRQAAAGLRLTADRHAIRQQHLDDPALTRRELIAQRRGRRSRRLDAQHFPVIGTAWCTRARCAVRRRSPASCPHRERLHEGRKLAWMIPSPGEPDDLRAAMDRHRRHGGRTARAAHVPCPHHRARLRHVGYARRPAPKQQQQPGRVRRSSGHVHACSEETMCWRGSATQSADDNRPLVLLGDLVPAWRMQAATSSCVPHGRQGTAAAR